MTKLLRLDNCTVRARPGSNSRLPVTVSAYGLRVDRRQVNSFSLPSSDSGKDLLRLNDIQNGFLRFRYTSAVGFPVQSFPRVLRLPFLPRCAPRPPCLRADVSLCNVSPLRPWCRRLPRLGILSIS